MLNRSSARYILKCSVTSIPIDVLLDDEEAKVSSNSKNPCPNNSFNLYNILGRYKSRCTDLEDWKVYMYCAKHYK